MAPSTPAPRRSHPSSGRRGVEYSTVVADEEDAKVAYLTADHLGSPRINTDRDGKVTTRHDYHPFGEEIVTAQRTSHAEYTPDSLRKQFTGYERDGETDLDFAQARTYRPRLGRFEQCDPIILSKGHPGMPQRWNAYIYVLNAPTVATDPDGRKPKRVIDVFLAAKETDPKSWKAIQKYAKKHNAVVNIYSAADGTATVERFKDSLQAKGRTVVLIANSYVPGDDRVQAEAGTGTVAGKGVGVALADYALASPTAESKGMLVGADTLDGVESKARNLVVLSCDFGDTFAPVGSNNRTNFLWATGGTDGLTTTVGTVEKVGKKMVEVFARGGSAREAQNAGSAILALAPGNDGETMIREKFQPLEPQE